MYSVHAISLIYELRALRSRLDQSIQQLYVRTEDLEWMIDIVELMIRKVERTGAYIQDLEDALGGAPAQRSSTQAGMGPRHQRGVPHHCNDGDCSGASDEV